MVVQKLSKLRTGKVLVLLLDSSQNNPILAFRDIKKDRKTIVKVHKNA